MKTYIEKSTGIKYSVSATTNDLFELVTENGLYKYVSSTELLQLFDSSVDTNNPFEINFYR